MSLHLCALQLFLEKERGCVCLGRGEDGREEWDNTIVVSGQIRAHRDWGE